VTRQLQIRIHPDGKIDAKTLGIKGKDCLTYIDALEKLLNAKVVSSEYTSEYYEVTNEHSVELGENVVADRGAI